MKTTSLILQELDFLSKNLNNHYSLKELRELLVSISKEHCSKCKAKTYEECSKCAIHKKINEIYGEFL